ncbi:HD domain-containing protein [Thermosulfurimonas marina]|uniref:HD domain-containing protein n=1 Tax=Thermosulfurimonas marina TaxID=2047767 RepID=A0A6H1WUJ3_9BACT|nr:HD domain-containing protein [Thermosulfurimonas marina]QJA06824.1 HD domain-containing protein [Thermosulfurimonas marina]
MGVEKHGLEGPEEVKNTALKVSLAGLFHDVGKFSQEYLRKDIPSEYRERNADLYLRYDRSRNRHTHEHALYTAYFIERFSDYLPSELNSPDWGEGEREDSFINLAAKHHRPETPLQWIITQADCLSSGIDRAEFERGEEIGIKEYRTTRLLPLFERLLRRDKDFEEADHFLWRYPLSPLSPTSIFPVRVEALSREKAREEYQNLFEGFTEDLKKLCHKEKIELWAQHFDSLLRIYTSHIIVFRQLCPQDKRPSSIRSSKPLSFRERYFSSRPLSTR